METHIIKKTKEVASNFDIEYQLLDWKFDSHLWGDSTNIVYKIECRWCGLRIGHHLDKTKIPLCRKNPEIKDLLI